jgi:hypothetical protein
MYIPIIASAITTLGAFILVYLSVIKEGYATEATVIRERLDNFYIPFYRLYCSGFSSKIALADKSLEARSAFFDLMTKNIHYMDTVSQSLYPHFYLAFINLLEAENGNSDFDLSECRLELEKVFTNLCDSIFTEYKNLLKKAKLPVPKI